MPIGYSVKNEPKERLADVVSAYLDLDKDRIRILDKIDNMPKDKAIKAMKEEHAARIRAIAKQAEAYKKLDNLHESEAELLAKTNLAPFVKTAKMYELALHHYGEPVEHGTGYVFLALVAAAVIGSIGVGYWFGIPESEEEKCKEIVSEWNDRINYIRSEIFDLKAEYADSRAYGGSAWDDKKFDARLQSLKEKLEDAEAGRKEVLEALGCEDKLMGPISPFKMFLFGGGAYLVYSMGKGHGGPGAQIGKVFKSFADVVVKLTKGETRGGAKKSDTSQQILRIAIYAGGIYGILKLATGK